MEWVWVDEIRLSDFLYVAARWAALQEGIEPVKWEKQGI